MNAQLSWVRESRAILCRVCGFDGIGLGQFEVDRSTDRTVHGVRCPQCRSIDLDAEIYSLEVGDGPVDEYIENGVSVDAISSMLLMVDPATVGSFLDVGSNYGFGVHVAKNLLGWHAEGVEPGSAGRRGARELGITIHDGYLTAEHPLDLQFDLILASEVIEHVDDPAAFMLSIRANLAPGGRVLLTTPNAGFIEQGADPTAVLVAVSPGFHVFIASAEGLEALVRRAGFASVAVERVEGTLRLIAAVEDGVELAFGSYPLPEEAFVTYLDETAEAAPKGSALASGMATRHFRALVNLGLFENAMPSYLRAVAAIERRHGIDAGNAPRAIEQIAAGHVVPWNLIPAAYHRAMYALLGEHDAALAAEHFDLTIAAANARAEVAVLLDLDTSNLRVHALRHRILALARSHPRLVPAAIDDLAVFDTAPSVAEWMVRGFVELVGAGEFAPASVLMPSASTCATALLDSTEAETLRVGFDGLFMLGMYELQKGSPLVADGHLLRALNLAERMLDSWPDDDGLRRMLAATAEQRAIAERLAAELRWADVSTEVRGAVSVVMPVYNGAAYLRAALRTVVAQELQPLELILIDDGSTDGSAHLFDEIVADFPVVVIRQRNAGQSAARNAGVRAAKGEYIAFLDQDDEWRTDHLATLVPMLDAHVDIGWAFTDFDQIDGEGQTITRQFMAEVGVNHPKRSLISVIANDLIVLPSASALRRRAVVGVNGFDTRLVGYEDDDLFVRLFRSGWTHAFEPRSTVRYRVHAGGASSTPVFLRSRLIFLQTLLETVKDDHRHNYYFSQDVILPRFYGATISDYFDALVFGEWERSFVIADALRVISTAQGTPTPRRRLALASMRHPRQLRRALLLMEKLPRFMRPPFSLNFSQRSVIRARRSSTAAKRG